jgi:hypothetical protein
MSEYSINPKEILRADDPPDEQLSPDGRLGGMRKLGRLAANSSSRDKITMAHMKAKMTAYWKDGDSYLEICEKVSDEFGLEDGDRLKPNNLHYHIKTEIARWKEVGLYNIDEKYAIALQRWSMIEALATEGFFASMRGKSVKNYEKQIERARSKEREKWLREQVEFEKQDAAKTNRKPKIHDVTAEFEELAIVSEKIKEYSRFEDNLAGAPAFLRILVDINDKRCKMWNLYARERDMATPDQEMARLSDDERNSRIGAVLMNVLNRKRQAKLGLAPAAPLGGFSGEVPTAEKQRVAGVKLNNVSFKDVNFDDEEF